MNELGTREQRLAASHQREEERFTDEALILQAEANKLRNHLGGENSGGALVAMAMLLCCASIVRCIVICVKGERERQRG